MPWKETDVVELRMEAVIRRLRGERVSDLSREFGVQRKTIHKWVGRFRQEGVGGLLDRSRRPKRSPNRISKAVERRIIEVRQEFGWGGKNLSDLLAGEGVIVSASTIDRVIARNGLIREQDRQQPAVKRFERKSPNELWQMDFKGEYRLPGGRCTPLSIIDDCTRYSIGLFGLRRTTTEQVSQRLIYCFEEFGLPDAILMDHGSPWYATTHATGLSRISILLIEQGIRPIYSRVCHPQTQGKVERFHRTMSRHLKWRGVPQEFNAMCDELQRFRRIYNEIKPHSALNRQTPSQRYQPSKKPYNPNPPKWQYPAGATVRKLTPRGTLHWNGHLFFVSQSIPDQHVWIHELDHRLLVVYRDFMIREINTRTGATSPVAPVRLDLKLLPMS
jgi:transposase InsO family protein